MGELQPPLLATVSSSDKPTIVESKQSVSPAPSDQNIAALPVCSGDDVKPQPGRGSAIFSTDLGRLAPRGLQRPGFYQPIARSNMVMDVVVGAGHLLRKYPHQYMNIFPEQNWQIGDLWDDHDIQVEGQAYFTEVLGFIERDNVVRVQKYAYEYAQKHPERLNLIGSGTAALYDKANPLSIVDKVFVNGESRDFPHIFLWKVAHFLRTSMLAVMAMPEMSKKVPSASALSVLEHKNFETHSTEQSAASNQAVASVPDATSSTAKASIPVVQPAPATPNAQVVSTWHQEQQLPRVPVSRPAGSRFGPPTGSVGGGAYTDLMGHIVPVLPVHPAVGPSMVHPGVHVSRTRPGRSASGSRNQLMPANSYAENMPRVRSGPGLRQHTGLMSATQSPRLHPAHMAINQNNAPSMMPYQYDQESLAPGTMTSQPHPVGFVHPGYMPPHPMQVSQMAHAYPRQPSNANGPPFAIPMGDMTNMYYGPPGMPMQNMDSRLMNDRRLSQQHANGHALYDPYEGSNPGFRNSGYPGSKKYNQNGPYNSNGRPRKPSYPGSRPHHGQYTNGRPQVGGPYVPGSKPHLEEDRAVTQDRDYGCHIDWIGPQNTTVNELFVKNLPENIREAELEGLFQERIGVRPTSVNIRFSPQLSQQTHGRKHAFIGFPSYASAKQALAIHSPSIRGLFVSITVPKRFFQKTLDIAQRDSVEAGPSAYSRYTSNPNNREGRNCVQPIHEGSDVTASTTTTKEKLSYSPQDARSDLPKKKKGKQAQQEPATAGSPEARKVKPKKQRQESFPNNEPTAPTDNIEIDDFPVSAKADEHVSTSISVDKTTSFVRAQTKQPKPSEATPSTAPSEALKGDTLKPVGTEVITSEVDCDAGAANTAPQESPRVLQEQADHRSQQTAEPHAESIFEASSVKLQVTFEATASKPALLASLHSEEPVSEDELKNDVSFHSVAESQSELEVKVDTIAGSDMGTATSAPAKITTTNDPTTIPSQPAIDTFKKDINTLSEVSMVPTSATSSQESEPTIMLPATSEAAMVPITAPQETKTPVTTTLAVVQAKKTGPQQTEALFPLSKKQLVAQAKKEKEQKKKAQKKEKELTQKLKAEKAAASKATTKKVQAEDETGVEADGNVDRTDYHDETTLLGGVELAGTSVVAPATTQHVEKMNSFAKKSVATSTSQKVPSNSRDKQGKRKGKPSDIPATGDTAPVENKSKDHGKQSNGTSIFHETGSVTNKDMKVETHQEAQEMATKETTEDKAPVLNARSSKQNDGKEAPSGVADSNTPGPSGKTPTPSEKKKNKKKKRNTFATEWPSLEFRPKSPNPAWMGPIDMETDVQNYERIMDEACGGSDDSNYSWSEIPTMEDAISSDEGEASADTTGGSRYRVDLDANEVKERKSYADAIFPKIQQLHPNMATEILSRIVKLTTIEEMAKIATDSSALIAKADEILLFYLSQNTAHSQILQPTTTQPSTVSREENADRHIAALGAQIATKMAETAVVELNIASSPSDVISPDSQPTKKKKANKHKNKKKRPAENGEAFQSGDTVEPTGSIASTPSKAATGPIDPKDPWAHQLREVDAVISMGQDGTADSKVLSQLGGGTVTPTDEPTLMRTMEAYFREAHPERMRKGRKVVQEDL